MKLNHLNLTVSDVAGSHAFLEKYFGLTSLGLNRNMGSLTDQGGLVLSLMGLKVSGGSEVRYPATFHIGFMQASEAQVDEINRRLKADGSDVPAPSR